MLVSCFCAAQAILGWKLRDDEGVKAPEFGQVTQFPLVPGPRATASQFLGATQVCLLDALSPTLQYLYPRQATLTSRVHVPL